MGIRRLYCFANPGVELSEKVVDYCRSKNCQWLQTKEVDENDKRACL